MASEHTPESPRAANESTSPEQLHALVAARLGHSFARAELLRTALTHRSFRNERPKLAPDDNERLEFLGDAVLGMTVAALVVEAFPDAREGELTRRRADLVCEAGLADVANDLGVGPALLLGRGEDRTGGREKPRLLASAFEALVGAVFLDGGPTAAVELVHRLFTARVDAAEDQRDPKSELQERLQSTVHRAPYYRLEKVEGPEHEQMFFVEVLDEERCLGRGEGRTKADAERDAARQALSTLE